MEVTVSEVEPERTYRLRQRVLRPHQGVDEVAMPGDRSAGALHLAAVSGDEVVGVVSFWPERPDWAGGGPAFRLRGMATAPEVRGTGVGALLLRRVLHDVAARGGGLLWCHARLAASGFYARHGFERRGDEWEEPHIGPHVVMFRRVDGA
ncbi:MAG TPA: GNAT family N-acetyltransferase [Acidimicrobiales bacterium]|nr:GNAT family N-acetyltransferase [Acidimicrobiales bacterium]